MLVIDCDIGKPIDNVPIMPLLVNYNELYHSCMSYDLDHPLPLETLLHNCIIAPHRHLPPISKPFRINFKADQRMEHFNAA
jgi:hypothetical protein